MGIFKKILKVGKSVLKGAASAVTGIPGALISGAIDLGGKYLSNKMVSQPNAQQAYDQSQNASAKAFERSYGAYKTRYQDTMADMKKAGLNPILAASSGGFNVGSSPQMKPAQSFLPVVSDHQFSSSAKNVADTGKAIGETTRIWRDTQKIRAETLNTIEQIAKTRAEKGLVTQQEANALKTMRNLEKDWWIKVQSFNKITQEGYLAAAKKHVALAQEKLIKKQTQQIALLLEQLKKTAAVYQGPAGQVLGYINAIMQALNMNLGIFGGIKR